MLPGSKATACVRSVGSEKASHGHGQGTARTLYG